MHCDYEIRNPRNREQPVDVLYYEITQKLLEEIGQGKTRELERYLGLVGYFPSFSLYNHHLLYAQRPDATFVATLDAWNARGTWVRKGEKAIWLADGKSPCAVFDAKQVDPRYFRPRADALQMNTVMRTVLFNHDIYHGDLEPIDVPLQERRSAQMASRVRQFQRYAQALACVLIDPDDSIQAALTRKDLSHFAEAVGFVVSKHFGLDLPFQGEELGQWGKTVEALRDDLELVRQVSIEVIQELRTPEYGMMFDALKQIHHEMQRPKAHAEEE
jgi:hypothetical protein